MSRIWLALVAAATAIILLVVLIYNSRPVGAQVFSEHYARIATIDLSVSSYTSLMEQIRAARRDGRATGTGVAFLRSRLLQARDALSGAREPGGDDTGPWSNYKGAIDRIVALTGETSADLDRLGRAVQTLRQDGPAGVQRLRSTAAGPDPQRFFQLLLQTLNYSQPGSTVDAATIDRELASLNRESATLSPELTRLIDAAMTVLAVRDPLDSKIVEMDGSPLIETAAVLRQLYDTRHAQRLRSANNARILVSVYSLLLFGGLAFLGARLHRSYRDINDINEQLRLANEGLEQRVQLRTRDLEAAFRDLQESQVQLVQAEKMASLGQLVAGISHEINTPLLYLQSNATLSQETLGRIRKFVDSCHDRLVPRIGREEDMPEARRRYVAGLQELRQQLVDGEIREDLLEVLSLTEDNLEGLQELTRLAQGLKDFSRLDRAPVDSFDVNEGIEKTLLIARNLLKHRIQVRKDLGDVPLIRCSPSQINQIILNLISNAAQAIEGQGEIGIATRCEDGFVVIEIRDDGVGIPADIIHKVRDPFFTTKEAGSGTGLGLSIVTEILRSHHGRLEIESQPGSGSTFTVYLPVDYSDGSAAAPPAAEKTVPLQIPPKSQPSKETAEDEESLELVATGTFVRPDARPESV